MARVSSAVDKPGLGTAEPPETSGYERSPGGLAEDPFVTLYHELRSPLGLIATTAYGTASECVEGSIATACADSSTNEGGAPRWWCRSASSATTIAWRPVTRGLRSPAERSRRRGEVGASQQHATPGERGRMMPAVGRPG